MIQQNFHPCLTAVSSEEKKRKIDDELSFYE